jgi:ribonuclease BN (tRNA processing enzyme)
MTELLILGSGGWIPTKKRQTCSYVYKTENTIILLDAGSGISNLQDHPDLLNDYKTINLILSHYHIDHIVGLSYLLNWIKEDQNLVIWAPGNELYKKSSEELISTFVGFPYFSRPIKKFSQKVSILDYTLNGFQIEGINIKINPQQHSDPSFGIQLDNNLYYATDTNVSEKTFELSQNCELLLHECWDLLPVSRSKHSSLQELIEVSSNYKNKSIGLIHLNPNWTEQEEINANKMLINNSNIFLAYDGNKIEFD